MNFTITKREAFDLPEHSDFRLNKLLMVYVNRGNKFVILGEERGNIRFSHYYWSFWRGKRC